jgi:UDP-N-acetylglucosamine transferase subunit ALG13
LIFVTVGTQFPFDRLIRAVDAWAGHNKIKNIVAQIGVGQYKPTFMETHSFIPPDLFRRHQNDAQLLISHAGMGTILGALEDCKPLIIMPRKASLGEHRNDHQMATAKRFQRMPGIYIANDVGELGQYLDKRLELSSGDQITADASTTLLAALSSFLNGDELMTQHFKKKS